MPTNILLKMRNIHVSYDDFAALKGVDFNLYKGEIHAIIGEHGAGKSSLVKLISGALKKKQGDIFFLDKKIQHQNPKSAIQMGIGMIYQNLNIIPNLTAIENIFIGNFPRNRFGVVKHYEMYRQVLPVLKRLELNIDLYKPVEKLTAGQLYMIELARIMVMDADLIILDEISNKLTPAEMKKIYPIIFEYKKKGKSIIYISHDIEEILKLADRVTILNNGYRRGTEFVKDLNKYTLFQLTYSFALYQKEFEKEQKKLLIIKFYIENILQNLPIGIIILDLEQRVHIINIAAVRILELKQSDIMDQSVQAIMNKVNLDIMDDLNDVLKNDIRKSRDKIYLNNKKWIDLEFFPFKDERFQVIGATILIQDSSLEQQMKNYMLRTEKITSVAEVAVGVAHEINNPLYIIKNYLELLKNEKSSGINEKRINKIEKEVERIVGTISSLLSFSKINQTPDHIIDLKNVLTEVIILLDYSLQKKNVNLKKKICKEKCEIKGDENRLKQLFINLINNSMEAILDGGTIELEIKAIHKHKAEINISDNGYGIPAEIHDFLFNPFYTTKLNKKNTGLGLPICEHIIKEHKGGISFSSIPGVKTTFKLNFPLV